MMNAIRIDSRAVETPWHNQRLVPPLVSHCASLRKYQTLNWSKWKLNNLFTSITIALEELEFFFIFIPYYIIIILLCYVQFFFSSFFCLLTIFLLELLLRTQTPAVVTASENPEWSGDSGFLILN